MKNIPQILIIDDEKDIGLYFKKVLAPEGYTVYTALDGIEGLQIVKEKNPDIVLLDLKMPKMDGIEVLQKIKKIDKNLIVIVITAYGTMETARMAMKFGAFDYITKPVDLEYVKAVIRDGLKLTLRAMGDKMKNKKLLKSVQSQQANLGKLKHCQENSACFWEVALRSFVLGDDNLITKWMEDPMISRDDKLELTIIAEMLKADMAKNI